MPRTRIDGLTPREAQIKHLLEQGKRPAFIASLLGISIYTVRNTIQHMYSKQGIERRRLRRYRRQIGVSGWYVLDLQTGAKHGGEYTLHHAKYLMAKWNEQYESSQ
jgi:DNA-binding CsgD family transcriptional regulator